MIETDRLILRAARSADAEPLFEVFSNAGAMRYWSSAPHESVAQTVTLVEGIAAIADQDRYFVIEHRGRAVGTAGFWEGDEIGYILHPDLWGQGFGAEVLRILVAHGFETLGLAQITADVDPRNAASIGLLGKLGFKETGRAERTIQIGEDWFDSIYFALSRPAVGAQKGPPG